MSDRTDTLLIYRSAGQWYWTYKASNGQILADAGGYNRRTDALRGAATVCGFDARRVNYRPKTRHLYGIVQRWDGTWLEVVSR